MDESTNSGGADLGAMLPMLLSMLGGGEEDGNKNEPEKAEKADDGFDLSSILSLAGSFSSLTGDNEHVKFLHALKPLLSEERRERVDEAIRLLKLTSLLPLLQDSGLLGGLGNLFGMGKGE